MLLVIGLAAGWILLGTVGSESPQDRARLEVVRTTISIVAGVGGATALLLAARRQRTNELALLETKHDAAERRTTELYSAAIEQLGADKAAVRLGGLYALERLAQDNLEHRQTIVEVMCAYLRMPLPEVDEAAPVEGLELAKLKQAISEERRVRHAAQHILCSHLRPGKDGSEPANSKFWPDTDLYLAGAVLRHLNFSGCHVRSAVFSNATLEGSAMLVGAVFDEAANFVGASMDHAVLHGATFRGPAMFSSASIMDALFTDVRFAGPARFDNARLDDTDFSGARFEGVALFENATTEDTNFDQAVFTGSAPESTAARDGRYAWVLLQIVSTLCRDSNTKYSRHLTGLPAGFQRAISRGSRARCP
ncbi:pentapeptide repeat-containing protein [Saccharopolyspora elongata]|uniref:Pentapeptide repeat-containing protein n=1 Tax=Saccharopolyspora elongata TaxID=2530387 RepID=A0A4V2YIM1_9PSEU|nr:pentapeptide repeat-containing protein [Saccharopolyspora elongata]